MAGPVLAPEFQKWVYQRNVAKNAQTFHFLACQSKTVCAKDTEEVTCHRQWAWPACFSHCSVLGGMGGTAELGCGQWAGLGQCRPVNPCQLSGYTGLCSVGEPLRKGCSVCWGWSTSKHKFDRTWLKWGGGGGGGGRGWGRGGIGKQEKKSCLAVSLVYSIQNFSHAKKMHRLIVRSSIIKVHSFLWGLGFLGIVNIFFMYFNFFFFF